MADEFAQAEADFLESIPGFGKQWEHELRRGVQRDAVLAEIARERIAKEEQRVQRNAIEGVGELVMRVPLSDYLWCMNRWGRDCWADKGFKDDVMKKNPHLRVRNKSKKIQILVP